MNTDNNINLVIIVSADTEWKVVESFFKRKEFQESPYGKWFVENYSGHQIVLFHGGWGKVKAAGSCQYIINKWNPKLIVNLGTCGGFEGEIKKGKVILVTKTIIYDIIERMGDRKKAIDDYTVSIDMSFWTDKLGKQVRPYHLISADHDISPQELSYLKKEYKAIAGDWESGAIAFIANINKTEILILRIVSDLVGVKGSDFYNNTDKWQLGCKDTMEILLKMIPQVIECYFK